jgi:hypothetical protein
MRGKEWGVISVEFSWICMEILITIMKLSEMVNKDTIYQKIHKNQPQKFIIPQPFQ